MEKNNLEKKHPCAAGSVLTEYLITTGILSAVLFLPLPGVGYSVVHLIIRALNEFQNHSTVFLSMP